MVKYSDVKLFYSCPAACPIGIFMDRSYVIKKDLKGFYFTDGNYEEYADIDYIKMLFSPQGITWDKVDFSDEKKIEIVKAFEDNKKYGK
jgi:hypothetical protein